MKQLLIAGCGDLGIRLSERLDPKRWRIHGLRRQTDRLPSSIKPVQADLSRPETLQGLEPSWEAVVYQLTPDTRDPSSYRAAYITGLANLMARVDCRRLIFVSSTAVYGQDEGQWVCEDSDTSPTAFNGQILLEAEHQARSLAREPVIVRFSGIYGPGRDYLLRQLRAGQARCRARPPQWTNRIHVDDCAAVLEHLLTLPTPQGLYCASDQAPVARCELMYWLADQMGVPGPDDDPSASGQGKRIASQRLLDSGFAFRFPDYQAGYGAMLSCQSS